MTEETPPPTVTPAPAADGLPPPPPQKTSDRLASIRAIVIGVVLMWVVLMLAWAGRKALDDRANAQREERASEARLRLAGVDELQGVFNTVNAAIEPAVVKIDVFRRTPAQDVPAPGPGGPGGTPGGVIPEANSGSGVVVEVDNDARRPFGFVVTNNHVVRNADSVLVTLSDGRTVDATPVGTDPDSDLAVLRVVADGLIAAEWGDSDALRKGDWVLAFGSPFGFVGSMTAGIVSALNRTQSDGIVSPFRGQAYQDFIQVDAAINPGNSGGPLVDIAGKLVGINTAIFTRTGDFSGIGFAIPSNQAKRIYEDIRDHGRAVRGWVGVGGRTVREVAGAVEKLGLPDDGGVLIENVFRDTPAAEAGLQRGDVIRTVDGEPVSDFIRFRNVAGLARPGDTLELGVFRNRDMIELKLVVGEQPAGQLALDLTPLADKPYGLALAEVDGGGPPVVSEVEADGVAFRAGLRPGDRVYAVGGRPVAAADEARALINVPPPQLGVEVRVMSGDRVFNVLLREE